MIGILACLIAFVLGFFVNICLFPYLLGKAVKMSVVWIHRCIFPVTIQKTFVWTTAFIIAFAVAMLICDKRVKLEKEDLEKEYVRKVDSLKTFYHKFYQHQE